MIYLLDYFFTTVFKIKFHIVANHVTGLQNSNLISIHNFHDFFKGRVLSPGFPDSLVGKESTCNAGDPTSIPGLGISAGEGIGCPLHYSWAFLVTLMVKNPPAMWEIWVRSLGWEDPLEKGKATHFVFWLGEFHGLYSPWGHKELDISEQLSLPFSFSAGKKVIFKALGGFDCC